MKDAFSRILSFILLLADVFVRFVKNRKVASRRKDKNNLKTPTSCVEEVKDDGQSSETQGH